MAKNQRTYAPEFREYVAKLIVQDGRKLVDVSNELDIPYNTLQKWVGGYRKRLRDAEKATQDQLLSASEYRKLYEEERQKLIDLQEENEILKKAMHIFTQEKQ
jgi:transposase